MRIFILDKNKITKFNLPEKIEDSFLVPYNSGEKSEDNFITIEAVDGNWVLKSNGSINIIDNNSYINEIKMDNAQAQSYNLKIMNTGKEIILYSLPTNNIVEYNIDITKTENLIIGNSNNSNINLIRMNNTNNYVSIKKSDDNWSAISLDNNFFYVNYQATKNTILHIGDIIFINGLKLVILKNYIRLYTYENNLSFRGVSSYNEETVDNLAYTEVADEDRNVDLYTEDDYFYHTPRIIQEIEPISILIEPPPSSFLKEEMPLILSLGSSFIMLASSSMMILNVYNSVSTGAPLIRVLPQIVMCFAMLFGSLLLPMVTKKYQKKKAKSNEKLRLSKYGEYLDKKQKDINDELMKEANIIKENYLSSRDCYDIALNHIRTFWNRKVTDDDFLTIRVGIGNLPSAINVEYPIQGFTLFDDELLNKVENVGKSARILNNVPITVNFNQFPTLGLILSSTIKERYINNIMIQLLALHSGADLKIIILTNNDNKSKWDYCKYIPHTFSEDKSTRFFAVNMEEAKNISTFLCDELDNRGSSTEEQKVLYTPYYLIITDDYKLYKNLPIIKKLENSSVNQSMSFITISESLKSLSEKCQKIVNISENDCVIMDTKLKTRSQIFFKSEPVADMDMRKVSISLSSVPLLTKNGLSVLPDSISFLDMFNVSKIEQLNIFNRWVSNNPVSSLAATIGVHADGSPFTLDLHEKFHGPHGLIAGSTGSGKSEFIITYILSLALNYHPYEVQFLLIDYKGGGLAGAFENNETGVKLPHVIGTITNLDKSEINRALVSISSELKRRQKKFNSIKEKLNESTMDIYKYQRLYREGLIDEPMAHLFIISDEFAELKSQQPEFLNELVSTARIGRSLGVHLILATQKPSGVVNDQIWSNSKFKICLKVQDKSDSNEILKKPDAASIKEAGRFYLQVGYDDYYDIGQSGWSGAKYMPSDKIVKKTDDAINFINHCGTVIKSAIDQIKETNSVNYGEQLTNTVKYINDLAARNQLTVNNLWLPKLPSNLFINGLLNKYKYNFTPYHINPVIGEYDYPEEQSQGLLTLDINSGNSLIIGMNNSGKESLLSTIIWGSTTYHSPEEINYYIIDCGAETLKMFSKFPHIGGIASVDDGNKILDILDFVHQELERRKNIYSEYGGSYDNYNENSGQKDPIITIIINNYEIFSESYPKIVENLVPFYRDGDKYGIKFIITCTNSSSIRARVRQYFNNQIMMKVADISEYRDVLGANRGFSILDNFGRGAIKMGSAVLEFQTAFITSQKELIPIINNAAKVLNQGYNVRAKEIKSMPDIITRDTVYVDNYTLENVPVGIDIKSKTISQFDFKHDIFNVITGIGVAQSILFIDALVKNYINTGAKVKIIDFVNCFPSYKGAELIKKDFDRAFAYINNELIEQTPQSNNLVYVIMGVGSMKSMLSETGASIVDNIFNASNQLINANFVLIDEYEAFKNILVEPWYSHVNNNNGIWIGPGIGSQVALNIEGLTISDRQLNLPNMIFVINNGNYRIVKHMIEIESVTHEE